MIWIYIAAVVVWLIAEILVLARDKVSKIDYGLIWFCLMIQLIGDLIIKLIKIN